MELTQRYQRFVRSAGLDGAGACPALTSPWMTNVIHGKLLRFHQMNHEYGVTWGWWPPCPGDENCCWSGDLDSLAVGTTVAAPACCRYAAAHCFECDASTCSDVIMFQWMIQ